jgi:hypothetical protein
MYSLNNFSIDLHLIQLFGVSFQMDFQTTETCGIKLIPDEQN